MMNKSLVLALIISALPLRAQTPESIQLSARQTFVELPSALPARLLRSVRVGGEVTLRGHGRIPAQDQDVRMLLSGSLDVQDDSGRVLARGVQVAYQGFLKVSGSSVSGYVYPEVYAPLERDGRPLGSVKLGGPVFVSGRASGNWALVSGRGRLWGYAVLND